PHARAARRRCRARRRGSRGSSARSRRPLGPGARAAGPSTRRSRCARRPGLRTASRRRIGPGARSRIRTPLRAPQREPGRGFFQDLALLEETEILTSEPDQLRALSARQAVTATACVEIGVLEPVADRLRARLELLLQALGRAPGPDELDDLLPELR